MRSAAAHGVRLSSGRGVPRDNTLRWRPGGYGVRGAARARIRQLLWAAGALARPVLLRAAGLRLYRQLLRATGVRLVLRSD